MNRPTFHRCHSSLQALSLGVMLFYGAGVLRAQGDPASNIWPRSYTVDDDEVVIYQPKVEKWDQNFLVARFAVGVKGKNDQRPIYGSFVARAETLANAETRMVSVYNFTAEDFKFPDAADRLEHIKRDIAAVSPGKPLNVPIDQLMPGAPVEETVANENGAADENTAADEAAPPESPKSSSKSAQASAKTGRIPADPPVVLAMQKGVAPLGDAFENDLPKGSDEEVAEVIQTQETKSVDAPDRATVKKGSKRTTSKQKEAPKFIREACAALSAPFHERTVYKEEPEAKPLVVRHVRSSDSRFRCFEKKVYVGSHGEILRHHHGVKHRVVKVKRHTHD